MAIECDGDEFHGIDQYEQDMQRQRMLERCGWVFFRVRASQFYAEKQRALLDLWGMLEERGIFPKTRKSAHEDKEQYIPDRPHQFQEADADICVKVGNTVVYIDLDNPETEKQALITSDRSNPEWGTINVNTPIAQALLGARAGDIVEAKLPRGTFEFLIKQIKNSK